MPIHRSKLNDVDNPFRVDFAHTVHDIPNGGVTRFTLETSQEKELRELEEEYKLKKKEIMIKYMNKQSEDVQKAWLRGLGKGTEALVQSSLTS